MGTTTTGATTTSTTTSTTTTTTTPPPTTTIVPLDSTDAPGPSGVDIILPPGDIEAEAPVVVMAHGGAWLAGFPGLLDRWAAALAAEGAVVFNASYRLAGVAGGGYPGAVDDIACAVRYARFRAPEFTDSEEVVIMGHSVGGQLAAVVALAGDDFGEDCPFPEAPLPDRLVGLAAIYDLDAVPLLSVVFMGARRGDIPEAWSSVNPIELVDRRDDLEIDAVVGGDDRLVPGGMAVDFVDEFAERGRIHVLPGVDHNGLQNPDRVGVEVVLSGGRP